MKKPDRYEPAPPFRKGVLFASIASAILGACLGRTLLGLSHNFAPWVLPAFVVGLVGVGMILGMLLTLKVRPRSND